MQLDRCAFLGLRRPVVNSCGDTQYIEMWGAMSVIEYRQYG
jgi:hypothetical protein